MGESGGELGMTAVVGSRCRWSSAEGNEGRAMGRCCRRIRVFGLEEERGGVTSSTQRSFFDSHLQIIPEREERREGEAAVREKASDFNYSLISFSILHTSLY